ncbi:MAG TPA: NAD(P)-dependent oxidoreductase [Candidatus Sulfotelmatobacter sp.]|nr:NAD(P)-dependent oxidoreductase [Candidatus Sulfotelmatobacter sp.]
MKAFIFDPLWDDLITDDLAEQLKASNLDLVITKDIAPLSKCAALFEGSEDRILCLNPDYVSWKLPSEDYKNIPSLKGIFGAATSTSWIDKTYANEKNIPVCDIKNFSTQAVAEWAITMMFNVARQTPRLIKDGFPLDYDKDFMKYRGVELQGKTAGIIGMGHIGRAIADRCNGLGMKVIFWSRSPKEQIYSAVTLERLMSEADVIFPAMELNDETKTIITDELLKSMKSSAIFISIVHDLFNLELILEMVKSGKLFGFGFESEPKSFNKYDGNVWAAPSYAWTTDSSMHNSMTKWIENMVNASKGDFPNRIN